MIQVCTVDIETTALHADFGIVLCAVIKPQIEGARPTIFRADQLNPHWKTRRSNDKAVVRAIRDELDQYDVLVAHNGLKFDLPFLRTRLAKWGLKGLPDKKLVDPVQLARNKLKMSWNSLDKLAEYLHVNSKTKVDGTMWLRAALDGDRRAMNYIVQHCVEDVLTLERIVDAVKQYSNVFNSWGSGR